MIKIINENEFNEAINNDLALLDFFADWCGPCKMMNPVIEKIANNNPDIKVAKVDIDESPNIARDYNILSIPTIIIFKNGSPADQTLGVVSEKIIMGKVNALK